jgi:MFS family permease
LSLAALTLGWAIAAGYSGRLYLRFGFRTTILIGMFFVMLGAVSIAVFSGTPSVAIVAISCFVIGFGMGLASTPAVIAAQSSVPWNERGVVTGTGQFARSIGSAVGVAIFGAIANAIFGPAPVAVSALVAGSGAVFAAVVVAGLLVLAAALSMPRTPVAAVEPAPA